MTSWCYKSVTVSLAYMALSTRSFPIWLEFSTLQFHLQLPTEAAQKTVKIEPTKDSSTVVHFSRFHKDLYQYSRKFNNIILSEAADDTK